MRPVDEALEPGGSAVGFVDRPRVHPVVAPVALAWERLDRHELDAGDAQLGELGKPPRRGVEGPLLRERAHVELVEDQLLRRQPGERRSPGVEAGIEHPGCPVDPFRLPGRGGVRARLSARRHEQVPRAVAGAGHLRRPGTVVSALHGVVHALHPDQQVIQAGGPGVEAHATRDQLGSVPEHGLQAAHGAARQHETGEHARSPPGTAAPSGARQCVRHGGYLKRGGATPGRPLEGFPVLDLSATAALASKFTEACRYSLQRPPRVPSRRTCK